MSIRSIRKTVWVLIGFFIILGILLRLLDGPILSPTIQSLYLSKKIDIKQVLYLRVGAEILFTIIGIPLFFKFCTLHFEWEDLVCAANILAGYTCIIVFLLQLVPWDNFVLNQRIWLLYTPIECFMSLTYLLSGHGYGLIDAPLLSFLPSILAPYVLLLFGIKQRKCDT